jgi:hypothetical protein
MAGRLRRGWAMARASFAVLRRYPKLAILPAISGSILLLAAGLIVVSLMPQFGRLHAAAGAIWERFGSDGAGIVWLYVIANAMAFVLTVVVLTLNAALIHCALRAHAGEAPSLRTGLAAAAACLPQIAGWAIVSSTVGVALYAIENVLRNSLGILGALIGGLFELGWSVVTYFVMPVLVVERLGPIAAIRRSHAILREKWGESLAGETRFALLGILFFLQALALFFGGLAISLSDGAGAIAGLGPALIALGVGYAIATMVVLQTLSAIFQAGVYVYAGTGRVPPSLDPDLVAGAFRRKD